MTGLTNSAFAEYPVIIAVILPVKPVFDEYVAIIKPMGPPELVLFRENETIMLRVKNPV